MGNPSLLAFDWKLLLPSAFALSFDGHADSLQSESESDWGSEIELEPSGTKVCRIIDTFAMLEAHRQLLQWPIRPGQGRQYEKGDSRVVQKTDNSHARN